MVYLEVSLEIQVNVNGIIGFLVKKNMITLDLHIFMLTGKFTEAQRNMYEAVEEIYKTCLQFCKPQEYTLDDIFHVMMALIAKQLIRLGVASDTISDKDLSQVCLLPTHPKAFHNC